MVANAALYQGILDNPDDDAARLVYADWLEENGDPQRAEFIRAQCYLAVLDRSDPLHEELQLRAAMLLEANRARWEEDVPKWARAGVEFRRGFVDGIRCEARHWVKSGRGLARRVPLRSLHLMQPVSDLETALNHPPTAQITRLRLDPLRTPTAAIAALANAAHLSNLRSLSLSNCQLGDDVQLLAQSPHLGQVTRLELNRNGLTESGIRALIAGPWRQLKELSLSLNDLTEPSSALLAQAPFAATLENLDLSMNRLADAGVAALAQAALPQLRWLSLSNNQILDAEPLAEWESLRTVVGLDLHANPLGGAGFRALARSPYLGQLRWLDLHETQIEADWLEVVAHSSLLTSLTALNLGTNALGDAGMAILGRVQCPFLARLDVAHNGLSPDGVAAIAWPNLRHLLLQGNAVGDAGVAHLAQSPVLGNIRTLGLSANGIGPDGLLALARSGQLESLRILHLANNPLGDEGARALLASAWVERLTGLDLSQTGMSAGMQRTVKERLGRAVRLQ